MVCGDHPHTNTLFHLDVCNLIKLYFNDWLALFDSCEFGTLAAAFVHCFANANVLALDRPKLERMYGVCVYDHRAQWISSSCRAYNALDVLCRILPASR